MEDKPKTELFSWERLVSVSEGAALLKVEPFVELLFEITKMFKAMGKTLSIAFSGRERK